MSRAKHWQFTLNNYTDDELALLESLGASIVDPDGESCSASYLIYGKEVSATGTPHLQGHVSLSARKTLTQIKALIAPRAHFEVVRLLQHHIEYCKKDGSYSEFGTPPVAEVSQGKRNDFDLFRATVAGGLFDTPELREKHPSIMARYPQFARDIRRDLFPQHPPPDHPLRAWQREVLAYVDGPVDPRTVLFVIDSAGNAGKTWFGKHLRSTRQKVQIIRAGKLADMALNYKFDTKIAIIDVPRAKSEHLQYSFLEELKDGVLFSPKYQSRMDYFEPPHVLVFMNTDPDMAQLSDDRYRIIKIS